MNPNVLIVGVGKGSWQIRGIQIGTALGARVTSSPTEQDWRWADVCILVKRALDVFASAAHAFSVPIIWDALDFWIQPEMNQMSDAQALWLAQSQLSRVKTSLVIGATVAMSEDLGGVYLPHHSRPRLSPAPAREKLQVVAYEGMAKYLGSWRSALEIVCSRLGLVFVVNPADLREADVIVAFRGEKWDGPICRRWKSGVKVVNALAAGRPLITQNSSAYSELQTPGFVVEHADQLESAILSYASKESRQSVANECRLRAPEFALGAVAARYRTMIESAVRRAA